MLETTQTKTQLSSTSVITIDGLAASGKSSVANGIANQLGVPYVSSGLLYRAVTFAAILHHVDIHKETEILTLLEQSTLKLELKRDGNRAIFNGQDITKDCHSSQVDQNVSIIALHPKVRAWVNNTIRALQKPFVAEGRDMGAVVFPDAMAKLFLTASSSNRAKRRSFERPEDFLELKRMIEARDAADAINSGAAPDAVVIDTEHLNLEEVIAAALGRIETALIS